MRRITSWQMRLFALALLTGVEESSADESVTVPLSTIIADGIGGTQKIRDIKHKRIPLEKRLHPRREDSRAWAATQCFLVAGHGGESIYNTISVFHNDVGLLPVIEEGQPCSVVFFSKWSSFYVTVQKVLVLDRVVEIEYRATSWLSKPGPYKAIIPMPALKPGDWRIVPRPLPLTGSLAKNQRYAAGHTKLLNEEIGSLIAGEGKFRVVKRVEDQAPPED